MTSKTNKHENEQRNKMISQNNKITWQIFKRLLLITSSFVISAASNAALFDCVSEPGVCIGEGDTVIFKYTGTTSSIGLFGTIEVIGDSIALSPTDFRAESNAGGTVLLDYNDVLQVIAKPGYQIDRLNISESGQYLLSAAAGSVGVDVDGWYDVVDWNDFFGPSVQQTLTISSVLTIIDGFAHPWQGSTDIDLTGTMWDGINHIDLGLQNNLTATATLTGELAWIEKNSIDLTVVTTAVPVPATAWLFGTGLIGIAGIARRKNYKSL